MQSRKKTAWASAVKEAARGGSGEDKAGSLRSYLAPLLANSRLYGSFPIDSEFRLSPLPLVRTSVSMAVMVLAGTYYSYISYGIAWNANASTYMGIVLLSINTAFLVTVANIRNRKKMKEAVQRITALDEYLWNMGVLFKYNRREMLAEIFLRGFFKMAMVLFDWIAYKESISQLSGLLVIISLYYSYFVIYNIQHQFTALLGTVRKLFILINEQVMQHTNSSDVIERFLIAHCHLSEACNVISDWFSPQLLLVCSLVFFVTTLNLSSMFMSLISFLDPYPPQITLFISCTFWVASRLFEMWETINICSSIETESKALGQKLSRLIINEEMSGGNRLLHMHFDCSEELSITASNFFKMDNSLFISMLSSATTYVVIMVQAQPQMKGVVCLVPSTANSSLPTTPMPS